MLLVLSSLRVRDQIFGMGCSIRLASRLTASAQILQAGSNVLLASGLRSAIRGNLQIDVFVEKCIFLSTVRHFHRPCCVGLSPKGDLRQMVDQAC